MRISKLYVLFFFTLLFPLSLLAQSVLKGNVMEKETNLPMIGVNILVKGTTNGVITDLDGNFSISAKKGDVLVFSYLGKTSQEVVVANQDFIKVTLADDSKTLDEVVVVGYGTQRKRDLTGSVISIKNDELVKQPSLAATAAIQGKVAGVQIVNQGRPGSSPQVKIRGVGTLNGSTSPLYIVDGMVTGDISNVSSSDIASMEILKDASSAAIYGARAANGVIIITTKKAKTGKFSVNYNGYVGISSPYKLVEMANAQEYAKYQNNAVAFDSPSSEPPFDNPSALGRGTNWIDQVTRAGLSHNHDLSVSGGTEKIKAFLSASYRKDESIIKGEDYARFTLRSNLEIRPTDWLVIKNNISFSDYKNNTVPGNVIKDAYKQEPTFSVLNDKGAYGSSSITNVANPVASLYYHNGITKGNRLQEMFSATATIVDGLKVKTEFGIDMGWNRFVGYTPVYQVSSNQKNEESILNANMYQSKHITWNNSINYSKIFNEIHRLNVDLILTTEEFTASQISGSRRNVPEKPNLWYIDQGDVNSSVAGGNGEKNARMSYVGRVGYTLMDRYILNATVRREGSSKFPSYNRFGYFPSIGGAWVISEEKFMQPLRNVVSSLKLKSSYGVIGNDGIPANAFIYSVAPGLDYVFGNEQNRLPGSIEDAMKDKKLKWETTSEFDLGLEFSMFDHRLNGEFAFYNKLTNGAFLNVDVDATLGGGSILTNYIDIRNRGLEFALNWSDEINDKVSYTIGTNWSFNRNKVMNIAEPISLRAGNFGSGYQITNTIPGQPIGQFFVYDAVGVFQSQDEINNYTWTNPETGQSQLVMPDAEPGTLKYRDVNNDGKINGDDMVFSGSYQPTAYFGLNLGLNFYGFDFSADFYGSFGAKIFNAMKGDRFGGENISKEIANNAWLPERPSASVPRPSLSTTMPSSYFIEKADYLRLNNVTLGYTIPAKLTQKFKINSLRVYTSVKNPFILTNYSGFNVEQPGGTLDSGIELDPYPNVREVMFGLSLSF